MHKKMKKFKKLKLFFAFLSGWFFCIKTKEQEEKKGTFRNSLIIKIMPSG